MRDLSLNQVLEAPLAWFFAGKATKENRMNGQKMMHARTQVLEFAAS